MQNTAVYPGTFDPFTRGHLHIVKRSLKMYDRVIISVSDHEKKNTLFSADERVKMIEDVLKERGLDRAEVVKFSNLIADHVEEMGARILIRGLRVTSDFEYEYKMAQFISELNPSVEVIYLMATAKTLHISSSGVKEIAALGGNVSGYLPRSSNEAIMKRFGKKEESN